MAQRMTERVAYKPDSRRGLLLLALAVSVAMSSAWGQSGSVPPASAVAKLPAYDVVAIKPNKSGSGSLDIESNMDTYNAKNITVKGLLEEAYGIRKDLISGVPGPIDSAHFDVMAKIVEPDAAAIRKLTGRQRGSMMLPILAERFQLKARIETRILPVFELVVVSNGPKFKRSADQKGNDTGTSIQGSDRGVQLTAHGISMASLASSLEGQVHRPVIDKTGLAGNFDVAMKWSSDTVPSSEANAGPSIYTALQEQLGLKLKATKGPVETLVVDHVEMPSEN
ncbi:TIGR03435 family protein [Granulicella sp. L56]|uniref:TIGR03435 family protein n=2 Tax=Acidobacteriaceae TaxID=204434 RepID=UPI0020B15726|nr:TIGR03435 family protein [Granulicella sp. L56]MDW5264915.1 TIGR03435 family protein [Edaphobacter sp.]